MRWPHSMIAACNRVGGRTWRSLVQGVPAGEGWRLPSLCVPACRGHLCRIEHPGPTLMHREWRRVLHESQTVVIRCRCVQTPQRAEQGLRKGWLNVSEATDSTAFEAHHSDAPLHNSQVPGMQKMWFQRMVESSAFKSTRLTQL